jgi:hypothetical protein
MTLFDKARRRLVEKLQEWLTRSARGGKPKPIGPKSALWKAHAEWEDFYPNSDPELLDIIMWEALVLCHFSKEG